MRYESRPRPAACFAAVCSVLRVLACLVLVLLQLSACAEPTPTPEPVTIRFAHIDFDEEHYAQLVEAFGKEYPHITVELIPSTWQELSELRPDQADAFVANRGLEWVLEKQGELLSLDPWIDRDQSFDMSDFYPGIVELYTRDEKTYAIPSGANPLVIYYNKDLFDRYSVPYPEIGWTWDDFLERAVAIRDRERGIFGYASHQPILTAWSLIYQHGGSMYDDWRNPIRVTFDDPLTIEALEWFSDLMHEYNVAPTLEQARAAFEPRYGSPEVGIRDGKIGMWSGYFLEQGGQRLSWRPGWEWTFRWGMAPLPRDLHSATFLDHQVYLVFSQTEAPDACWRWLAYLSEQMPHLMAPARRSLATSPAYEDRVGTEMAATVTSTMEGLLFFPPYPSEFERAASDAFVQALWQVMEGEATPEEALQWAQQEAEKRSP